MSWHLVIMATVAALIVTSLAWGQYEPRWQSLDKRPIPEWFDEAKFGIFIHWGVFSVPAWAPKGRYAEWYWHDMQDKQGATWQFHVRTYGEKFRYQDFAPLFKAELFDPDQWAELFRRAGARYVVLTAKHHDGFCLWLSKESWNWNSVDIGPHRDLVGELAKAVREKGLKFGLYYSLYEWFHPIYRENVDRYVTEHLLPQLKDLVTRYHPSLIFADGEWDYPSSVWRSQEFLAWLFNESPVKDEVVVNDRWGKETRSLHGGYFTSEYGQVGGGKQLGKGRKWEENRGMGSSFGYNRNEDIDDYASPQQLIRLLVEVVSEGGNLLLNVGPTADGRIPVIMQERLVQIGEWLRVNGESIYGTRPADWGPTDGCRLTQKGSLLFVHILENAERESLILPGEVGPIKRAYFLSDPRQTPLAIEEKEGRIHISLPSGPRDPYVTVIAVQRSVP